MGARVDWDEASRQVTFTKAERVVTLTIGQKTVLVNGVQKSMDTTPVIKDSRTMLPLRYVGEYLGAQVEWEAETRTVKVTQ